MFTVLKSTLSDYVNKIHAGQLAPSEEFLAAVRSSIEIQRKSDDFRGVFDPLYPVNKTCIALASL